jgi:hypothetical protein
MKMMAMILGVTVSGLAAAAPPDRVVRFPLPADPLALVTHEDVFRPFAEQVGAEVERMLGEPSAVDDPAIFRVLLSTRVHLAHHFADNEKAVATAAWIRSLQTDPAGRAFAGLTTLASVEARRQLPGAAPVDAPYRAAFLQAFHRRLAPLPATPEIVAMLRGQREKIAAIDEATLLAETREVIAPAITRRGYCGLEEADQLVRVRHRLVSILPVKGETLQALDAAIAARVSR